MKLRLIRLGLVASGLLALLGTTTPSAQAVTVMNTTFTADANIPAGLASPVVTGLPVVTDTTPVCLPLHGVAAPPNCHFTYNDELGVTLQSVVCTDTSTNIAKGPLPPEHVGPCAFGASGTVTGHCGLSSGQVSGVYTNSLGQQFEFNVHFNGVGGTVEFSGHWRKITTHDGEPPQQGLVSGDTAAVPPQPVTGGGSCLDGNATRFILAGDAAWVTTPLP